MVKPCKEKSDFADESDSPSVEAHKCQDLVLAGYSLVPPDHPVCKPHYNTSSLHVTGKQEGLPYPYAVRVLHCWPAMADNYPHMAEVTSINTNLPSH